MSPNTPLYIHQLLHTLNTTEIRYLSDRMVINYADQAPYYTALLQAIVQQVSYNQATLKASLSKDNPLIDQLAEAQVTLYRTTLNDLDALHASKQLFAQTARYIRQSEMLYAKNLFKQSELYLQKAEQQAQTYEFFTHLMTINDIKIKRLLIQNDLEAIKLYSQKQLPRYRYTLKQQQNTLNFAALSLQLKEYTIGERGNFDTNQLSKITALMQSPLISREDKALSNRMLRQQMQLNANYSKAKGDLQAACTYESQLLQLTADALQHNIDLLPSYTTTLQNLLNTYKILQQHDKLLATIALVEKTTAKPLVQQHLHYNELLRTILQHKINSYLQQKQFHNSLQTFEYINREAPKLVRQQLINARTVFYVSYAYFVVGNYSKALIGIEVLSQSPKVITKKATYYWNAQFLHLLIAYEQGNYRKLEALINQIKSKLNDLQVDYRYEQYLFDFMRSAINAFSIDEVKIFALKAKSYISPIYQNKKHFIFFDKINVGNWLGSIITNQSLVPIEVADPHRFDEYSRT